MGEKAGARYISWRAGGVQANQAAAATTRANGLEVGRLVKVEKIELGHGINREVRLHV